MRKVWMAVCVLLILCLTFGACLHQSKEPIPKQVLALYQQDINQLANSMDTFVLAIERNAHDTTLKDLFYAARKQYKHLEWLAEYYSPYTAKSINGPALAEVEPDNKSVLIQPEGFQVIEEILFPDFDQSEKELLLQQSRLLKSNIERLRFTSATLELTDAHIFDALRLEVFRLIALGLSGFDSPIAKNSIPETAAVLQGLNNTISLYEYGELKKEDASADHAKYLIQRALQYIAQQHDFDKFDRMKFVTSYLNPLSESILAFQKQLNVPNFKESRALKATAATLFSKDAFDPDFYAPNESSHTTSKKIRLGKKLFYETQLSKNNNRSCATCHQPQKAFTDGLVKNNTLNGKGPLLRNTPTLLNAALQPALFYDTRLSFLEDQANDVITNKDEMHGSFKRTVNYLKSHNEYQISFKDAFPNSEINEGQIKNAIASYLRSLVALNSRFDLYMRGDKNAMTKKEIHGFNVFMGKAKCGTCHFVPLFNGANPPIFSKIDAEVIGVPATSDTLKTTLDRDEGKFTLYNLPLHKGAFKTPTLRNIALTAPYMHNGVFKSLEEVIDFYDRGGGNGLGLHIDNQTLPANSLELSTDEKEAIIAFLKTLSDTSVTD